MNTNEPIKKSKDDRKNIKLGKLLGMVDDYRNQFGLTRSEVIRTAIVEYLQNHDFKPSK
jgi:metal-responsive CopG/Arc/MetJ family transcriptional regulator